MGKVNWSNGTRQGRTELQFKSKNGQRFYWRNGCDAMMGV